MCQVYQKGIAMSFEQLLRDRIAKAPFRSQEKETLRVVLGDVQQKASVSDEQGFNMVRAMIKNNNDKVLPYLQEGDLRRKVLIEENEVLSSLLPSYLTADQISQHLSEPSLTEKIKASKSEGQATGVAMKFFKDGSFPVSGDDVKKIVQQIRV